MTRLDVLEREVGRLKREMDRQQFAYTALVELLRILAKFAEDNDREALRKSLQVWAERLRDRG